MASSAAISPSLPKAQCASHRLRARALRQTLDQCPQPGARVCRAVSVSGFELCIQHQAQVANPVGVNCVAWSPMLVWVVADHRTGLLAVQGLDGGVAVQYPRRGGGLGNAVFELLLHPLHRACQLGLLRSALLVCVLAIGRGRNGRQRTAQA